MSSYEIEMEFKDCIIKIDDYVMSKGMTDEMFKMLKEEARIIFNLHIKNEKFVIDKVIQFIRRQELKIAILKSIDILEKDGNYDEVLSMIDKAISIGSGFNEGLSFMDLLKLPLIYKDVYDPSKLVKTGFAHYDAALQGGFAPGEIHILMGSPKIGKSTMGCNIGAHALISGKNVFHCTFEIKSVDVLVKYACRLTGMSYTDFFNCDMVTYTSKIERFKKYEPRLFVNYWPEMTANAMTIRSWISRKRSELKINPNLIIVDYDDLIEPISGPTGDGYNDAGTVYSDLIGLSSYFSAPCVSFAQPRREAWYKAEEGELISAQDLAHSAKKAHKAFSISSLNFKKNNNKGTLYVDMVRRGESNVYISVEKDLSRALFREA